MIFFTDLISSQGSPKEEVDNCIGNACYPSTGDLLVGRGKELYASSTCGTNGRAERFCVISNLQGRDNCYRCDSRDDRFSHIPKYMEIKFTDKKSWWQSENGKENVYLQVFVTELYIYLNYSACGQMKPRSQIKYGPDV